MKNENCELCNGTGWYGDNGPGIRSNGQYVPCENCNPKGETISEKKCRFIAPNMKKNTHCFVCARSLKGMYSVRVGEESLCETCHTDYWSWVMRGMAVGVYRSVSSSLNIHAR